MTLAIWGPGAVGLVLGARLARAGEPVRFVCRDPRSVERIARDGVELEDLADGASFVAPASAVGADGATAADVGPGPVLLCVRRAQMAGAVDALRRAARDALVVCVQNGVGAERALVDALPGCDAIGAVYRQTCTRRAPNAAVTLGAGRIVLGGAPRPAVAALAQRLRAAGYDVGESEHVERDQWLKLCVNLMSAPNALIRREDHNGRAFVDVKVAVLEEARAVLRAAGVRAESCDGRDRSLEEEIAFQRTALERGASARPLPLYNQVWSALRDGGPVEADEYHRAIVDLGSAHGVPTPANGAVLDALLRVARDALGPESLRAAQIRAARR